MRKLQDSDKFYIEKMRTYLRESSESSFVDAESSFQDNCFDQFNNLFIKYHRLKHLKIVNSKLVKENDKDKEHTVFYHTIKVYEVEVSTDELVYKVSRRFKEFHSLFQKVKKQMPGCVNFPSKNYNPFVSSVSPSIVQQRINKLDGKYGIKQFF